LQGEWFAEYPNGRFMSLERVECGKPTCGGMWSLEVKYDKEARRQVALAASR